SSHEQRWWENDAGPATAATRQRRLRCSRRRERTTMVAPSRASAEARPSGADGLSVPVSASGPDGPSVPASATGPGGPSVPVSVTGGVGGGASLGAGEVAHVGVPGGEETVTGSVLGFTGTVTCASGRAQL